MENKIKRNFSPNFDKRSSQIDMVVLHYTGMENTDQAIKKLCCANAKVSAHYLIDEAGLIYQLVDEENRAWHAGISNWENNRDINSRSIGIEIVNGGYSYGLPEFPDQQIFSLLKLLERIQNRYKISPHHYVAHSDIAPDRKKDPGEKFPWHILAHQSFGLWSEKHAFKKNQSDGNIKYNYFEEGYVDASIATLTNNYFDSELYKQQQKLEYYGYNIACHGYYDFQTKSVIAAFQRHFRPCSVNGVMDYETLNCLEDLIDQKGSFSNFKINSDQISFRG